MQTWKSDRYIYRIVDGSYQSQDTEEPRPAMAVELVARKGEEISRNVAHRNGWIHEEKYKRGTEGT